MGTIHLLALASIFPSAATELSSTLNGDFILLISFRYQCDESLRLFTGVFILFNPASNGAVSAECHYQMPIQFLKVSLLSLSAGTLSL